MSEQPLSGLRVLEIGGGIPAAWATRWMAGYGADVVRTEGPADLLDPDEEVYLLAGKRRIEVDDGTLRRLALQADIVIEDQSPGAMADRGLAPQSLRAERPQLVVTSITAYGQEGPYAAYSHTNLTAFAMGGIMSLTGDPARAPLKTGGSQAYYLSGLNAFSASLTAWYGALVHGEGDWLDISMQECAAGQLELYASATEFTGSGPSERTGNQKSAHWGIYPVADGYGGVCCLQRQIPSLIRAVGNPVLNDERFLNPTLRLENDDEMRAYLYPWFLEHTRQELLDIGREYRIPFGAVLTPAELLENESLAERGYFDQVETPQGIASMPGRPFLGLEWRAGPLHEAAADTDHVLDDWLGGDR